MADRFENGFGGLVAVVTGGGTGMGRELVRQLTAQGCDVATCDVIAENLAETVAICAADGNSGKILSHIADVSNEAQVLGFRDAVAAWRPHVNILFNNAGIGGGGSIVGSAVSQPTATNMDASASPMRYRRGIRVLSVIRSIRYFIGKFFLGREELQGQPIPPRIALRGPQSTDQWQDHRQDAEHSQHRDANGDEYQHT